MAELSCAGTLIGETISARQNAPQRLRQRQVSISRDGRGAGGQHALAPCPPAWPSAFSRASSSGVLILRNAVRLLEQHFGQLQAAMPGADAALAAGQIGVELGQGGGFYQAKHGMAAALRRAAGGIGLFGDGDRQVGILRQQGRPPAGWPGPAAAAASRMAPSTDTACRRGAARFASRPAGRSGQPGRRARWAGRSRRSVRGGR